MSVPARITAAGWLTVMSCALALSGWTIAGPRPTLPPLHTPSLPHTPAPRHTSAPQHLAASPETAPLSFPRLEGVYRQPGRSFVVTYQGWWLDLESEQIR